MNARSQYPAGARAPYAEAVYHGQQQIANYLVAKGAKRIAISLSPRDEFSIACYRDDADRARELVASDPSLLEDAEGTSHRARRRRLCGQSVRLLVELGVDVNCKAGHESPLHCAARAGQLETVKVLVELGADVHARDITAGLSHRWASQTTRASGHVVEYLLQFARIWEAVKYRRTRPRAHACCARIQSA